MSWICISVNLSESIQLMMDTELIGTCGINRVNKFDLWSIEFDVRYSTVFWIDDILSSETGFSTEMVLIFETGNERCV